MSRDVLRDREEMVFSVSICPDDLMKKIGRLEVENDFLRSVSLALGLDIEKPR